MIPIKIFHAPIFTNKDNWQSPLLKQMRGEGFAVNV